QRHLVLPIAVVTDHSLDPDSRSEAERTESPDIFAAVRMPLNTASAALIASAAARGVWRLARFCCARTHARCGFLPGPRYNSPAWSANARGAWLKSTS